MSLRPCPVCRRHVTTTATTCVFCAAALPSAPAVIAERPGRFARAAVFAGATLASACGGPQPAPSPSVGGGGPPADAASAPLALIDAGNAAPVDAGAPVAPPIDAAPPVVMVDAGPAAPVAAGVIQGVLLEQGNRRPRAGWEIDLDGPAGRVASTYTDDRGRFTFSGVAAGRFTLSYLEFRQLRPHSNPPEVIAQPVTVPATATPVKVTLWIGPQPVEPRSAQPMPYGAPPARRRVV